MVKEICKTAHSERKLKTEMSCFPYCSWRGAMALSWLLNRLEPHKIDSKLDSWILWSWCVDCIRVCSVLQQKRSNYHSFSMGSMVQLLLLQTCLELSWAQFNLLVTPYLLQQSIMHLSNLTASQNSQLHNSASCNGPVVAIVPDCTIAAQTCLLWLPRQIWCEHSLILPVSLTTPVLPRNSCSFVTC